MSVRGLIRDFIRKRNPLDIEHITLSLPNAPSTFTSLKIAHVSDVHIPRSAFAPCVIAEAVRIQSPDVIFLTGDVMDGRSEFDGPKIAVLIDLLVKIAPTYAVSGNHERNKRGYFKIWQTMLALRGVHFMNNKFVRIEKEGMTFVIAGVRDMRVETMLEVELNFLSELEVADDECYLILHHKPHIWRSYYPTVPRIPDVVFSGHAHGGQVRLPFIKRGLLAPNQGFFPKYVSGLYRYPDGSREIVSRGLASSTRPVRINNRPHLPVVELVSGGKGLSC